jgi:hypothetical protein
MTEKEIAEAAFISKIDDQNFIAEDTDAALKVRAVIIKEGVYQFPEGMCLLSRQELKNATRTARAAKVTIKDHPPGRVVMNQAEMAGIVEKPYYDLNRIRATLSFDKELCPPDFLNAIKERSLRDVSIGFYYTADMTPGEWNGKHYDLAMRNIVIDHVAAGVIKGRCSYPDAGIGLNAVMSTAALAKVGAIETPQDTPPTKPAETPPVPTPAVPEVPKVEAPPLPKTATKPPVVYGPVKTDIPTDDLIKHSNSILKIYSDRKIERLRHQRMHPT